MSTTKPRIARVDLLLAMSLYAIQGVVVAYLVNYNKTYMVAGGVDERVAGRIETAVLLTLVLKFLLGPLSDRFSPFGLGHRRPFILFGLVLQTIGLIGLGTVHPGTHLFGFGLMAFLAVGGLALYDTCCDGLIVDVTPPDDRVRVQGLVQVARFLATMGFTLLFGLWMKQTGIGPGRSEGVLWICAILSLPPLVLTCFAREREELGEVEPFEWAALGVLGRPRALVLLAFGALYGMVGMGVEFNLSPYYEHLGYKPDGIGGFGALRYGGRAAGALLLPVFHRWLGRRGELVAGLVLLSVATAGQVLVDGPVSAAFWAILFGLAIGWSDALFCVLAMEGSSRSMAASTFAVFMAVSNLSVLGNAIFLETVYALGHRYAPAFLVMALACLALLAMVPGLTRPRLERDLADVAA